MNVADSGLERTRTVVKGSTHWECREHTLIYQGADKDQLRSSDRVHPYGVYERIRPLGKVVPGQRW